MSYAHNGEEIGVFQLANGGEALESFDVDCSACTADCNDVTCGSDLCGGSCGACTQGEVCEAGQCEDVCTPDCDQKACGPDGCGGSCGSCDDGDACTQEDCDAGECLYSALSCLDPGPCQSASCDADEGCVYTPLVGLPCEDADPDDLEERCSAEGTCVAAVCAEGCADNENCVGGVCAACTSVDAYEPESYGPPEVLLSLELVTTMVELGGP